MPSGVRSAGASGQMLHAREAAEFAGFEQEDLGQGPSNRGQAPQELHLRGGRKHHTQAVLEPLDILLTMCHLAELPVPKDCEGAVLCQALKELRAIRKNVTRQNRMVKQPAMC